MQNQSEKVDFAHDYDSDFEPDERRAKRKKHDVALTKPETSEPVPKKEVFQEKCIKEFAQARRLQFLSKDAYTRHKEIINHYILSFVGSTSKLKRDRSSDKTDRDIIRENHHFLWEDDENIDTWEKQLSKKYYDKLFKEYCLADLSLFKKNKIAMRWRTESEVIDGKGQFSCGNIKCNIKDNLKSWEVNFAYVEHKVKKNALVKLRLCPACSIKLNWCRKRKEVTKEDTSDVLCRTDTCLENVESREDSRQSERQTSLNSAVSEENKDGAKQNKTDSIWQHSEQKLNDVEKPRGEEFEKFLCDLLL